jgi:hypothetical protein
MKPTHEQTAWIGRAVKANKEQGMKNEKTSARVSKIAGKILERMKGRKLDPPFVWVASESIAICSVSELKALAASALTQAPDRKKTGKSTTPSKTTKN